jgi:succinate-semialdehyde dehydrogenase/glutarate-semialdehyde dehydrogenase
VCTNRILVQAEVYDSFAAKLAEAVQQRLVVGEGTTEGVTNGPLINSQAKASIEALVSASLARGAEVSYQSAGNELGDCYYGPTILTNVTNDMPVAREEIFGPVAPLMKFHDEAEAIRIANDTQVGLASYFYSRDIGRVWRVAEQLEYGIVGINEGIISNEMAPFGGVKESGNGREGSRYGMEDYLEIKYMCMGGIE